MQGTATPAEIKMTFAYAAQYNASPIEKMYKWFLTVSSRQLHVHKKGGEENLILWYMLNDINPTIHIQLKATFLDSSQEITRIQLSP